MSEPVLSVRNLEVAFPTRRRTLTAVDRVSFDIAAGEVLGVVGESGAGKSLTGAAVIGLLEPPGRIMGGEVRLKGQRIDNLTPEEMRKVRGKRIGMVFQDPLTSLNPLYRIGDQIVETIRTHVAPCRRRRPASAPSPCCRRPASRARRARIDSYPHEFSGGMRQRVVLALALCAEPDLLIADEPTTALDVSIQAQIIALLKRLCRERGTAVMLITHDMGVIAETADRVAVMYAGRIVEIGPVRDVVQHPHHPYTKGLMGAIPTLGPARRAAGADPRHHAAPRRHPAGLRVPSPLRVRLRPLPRRAPGGDAGGALRGRVLARRPERGRERAPGPERGKGAGMMGAPLVEAKGLTRVFDVSKPWLSRLIEGERKAYLKAVTGVSFAVGRRETRGAGGRIGLRQVDGGAHDGGPAAAHGRHGQHRRHRHVGAGARCRAPEAAPAPADDLPGPLRQPQSALARGAHHRRPHQGLRAGQGQRRDRAIAWASC